MYILYLTKSKETCPDLQLGFTINSIKLRLNKIQTSSTDKNVKIVSLNAVIEVWILTLSIVYEFLLLVLSKNNFKLLLKTLIMYY
jgi:hypothetical protein